MYLDDGLAGAEDFDQASTLSEVIKRDLTELGFIIAESKSVWFPQQNIVWLGFEWDMSNGLPFPFLIVILAVISSFSVFLNIWFIIQICLRKAKETRLKKGNIKIKSEKETYMELNERDKTCHENQYDSLTYPNNYIDISDL
uniref:Reverse transcriptase domain-containing protein n=1 Tax=Magallana gigas TaxID=29159 RepID=A0A8W8JBP3_MAGGI